MCFIDFKIRTNFMFKTNHKKYRVYKFYFHLTKCSDSLTSAIKELLYTSGYVFTIPVLSYRVFSLSD